VHKALLVGTSSGLRLSKPAGATNRIARYVTQFVNGIAIKRHCLATEVAKNYLIQVLPRQAIYSLADPRVAHEILLGMLKTLTPRLELRLGATVSDVGVVNGAVTGLTAEWNGETEEYRAKIYIDATDLGELLPLAKVPWKIRAESHADAPEPHAPAIARPDWIQPITVPVALERRPDTENHRIPIPDNYFEIAKSQKFKVADGDITGVFVDEPGGSETLWGYRRYIDTRNFDDPQYVCDRSTINMGNNNYQANTIPTGYPKKDAQIVRDARKASLSYVYWLQTLATRDGEMIGSTPA
jgi:hypothetical protein